MRRSAIVTVVVAALVVVLYIGRGRTVDAPGVTLDETSTDRTMSEAPAPVDAGTVVSDEPAVNAVFVSGHVEDSLGHLAPHSTVEAEWETGSESVTADEEGRFSLTIPKDTFADGSLVFIQKGNYTGLKVHFSAALDSLRAFPEMFAVPQSGRDDVALVLVQPASIEGRVVDSNDTPQPGWNVYARSVGPAKNTASDDTGAFAFSGLKPGTYQLSAAAPHGGPKAEHSGEIELRAGEEVRGITLLYYLGQSLFGHVFSNDGSALANAWVRGTLTNPQINSGDQTRAFQARSDADGLYELAGIPEQPGVAVDLQVGHEDHLQVMRNGVVLDGTSQDFVLVKNPTIEGIVLDARTREPVTEYRLYSWSGDGFNDDRHLVVAVRRDLETHPDGRFSFAPRGVNEVRLAVSAPGYVTDFHRLSGIGSGETVTNVEILLKPVAPLTGTVVDNDGSPVSEAYIYLGYPVMISPGMIDGVTFVQQGSDGIARTDESGQFSIDEYPESLQIVSAYRPGFAPNWVEVDSFDAPIRIVLSKGARIEGVISYGGVPVEKRGAHVAIVSPNETNIMNGLVDDDGRYAMENVPIGSITVVAGFPDGELRRYIHRSVTARAGDTIRADFDFSETNEAYLEGTLLLNDRIVPLALLRAVVPFENGDEVHYGTETRSDGTYRLGPIPAATFEFGAVWIQLEDGSYLSPPYTTVTTRPGETTQHDLLFVR